MTEQTPEATCNIPEHYFNKILVRLNTLAHQAIATFAHRVVISEKLPMDKLKVHTVCSPWLERTGEPLSERISIKPCDGKGELIFKITEDALNLVEGHFIHTAACEKAPELEISIPGKHTLNESIESSKDNGDKTPMEFFNMLLHEQSLHCHVGYINPDSKNHPYGQEQAQKTVYELSNTIKWLSRIYPNLKPTNSRAKSDARF